MNHKTLLLLALFALAGRCFAQDSDLLHIVQPEQSQKEYVYGTFKSPRIIMSHSVEMLRPGVLDFRILHRFGSVNGGAYEFFGFDGPATVRIGFDYGVTNNLTVGIGRSSFNKEFDGFVKYRLVQQSAGPHAAPVSIVLVAGSTLSSLRSPDPARHILFSSRLAYYGQLLIGRKCSEKFSIQVMPTLLHRNTVPTSADHNDLVAMGGGARLKISRRVSINADYHYVFNPDNDPTLHNPLSLGVDIETGGHVFQLHFTNAKGMNERDFLAATQYSWGDGDIFFGFNISRSFQVHKKKSLKVE